MWRHKRRNQIRSSSETDESIYIGGGVSSVEYWLSWSAGRRRTIAVTLDRLFWVKLKPAGYPLHSPLSPSLLVPCVAVCHQIQFPLYLLWSWCLRFLLLFILPHLHLCTLHSPYYFTDYLSSALSFSLCLVFFCIVVYSWLVIHEKKKLKTTTYAKDKLHRVIFWKYQFGCLNWQAEAGPTPRYSLHSSKQNKDTLLK